MESLHISGSSCCCSPATTRELFITVDFRAVGCCMRLRRQLRRPARRRNRLIRKQRSVLPWGNVQFQCQTDRCFHQITLTCFSTCDEQGAECRVKGCIVQGVGSRGVECNCWVAGCIVQDVGLRGVECKCCVGRKTCCCAWCTVKGCKVQGVGFLGVECKCGLRSASGCGVQVLGWAEDLLLHGQNKLTGCRV